MSTRSHRTVAQGDGNAAYAAPGYLLFRQADDVVAQRFDLRKLAMQGGSGPGALSGAAIQKLKATSPNGDLPVLSVEPENEIQTADFALRFSLVITKEFSQVGRVNVVRRRVRGTDRFGREAPVDFGDEGLRVVDAGGG